MACAQREPQTGVCGKSPSGVEGRIPNRRLGRGD